MSLIAWYPFTKDFRNQGLSTDTITGTPVFVPSQFGQGLNLQGEKKSVVPELAGLKTFSVSYWVRINSDETLSSDWVNIVGLWDQNTTDTSGGTFRWQASYGTYKDTMAVGGPYNSSQNNICNNMGTITADKNVWHHICVVVDYESNKVSSYLNGVLKNSTTHRGGHLNNGTIVFGGNNINGIINDFRVYNHALSIKEIKELSKGLILHYDLKGFNTNPNLIYKNEVYSGDGTPYYVYKEGPSTSTVMFFQSPVMNLKTNTDYTLSFDARLITDDDSLRQFVDRDLYPDSLPQSNLTWTNGVTNKWKRYTWTMSSSNSDMNNARVRIFVDNTDPTSGNKLLAPIEFRNIKFEESSVATPFIQYDQDQVTEIRTMPSGYSQLEYIENIQGLNQYINTGYTHTATTRVDMVCTIYNSGFSYESPFGARLNTYQNNCFTFFSRFASDVIPCFGRTGAETRGTNMLYNEKILISAYNKTCSWYKYGSSSAYSSITTTGTADAGATPMFLFNLNRASTAGGLNPDGSWCHMKLYSCKIWDDNGVTLARDFVPALRKSDNKIGLYDFVTETFYTNAGSGNFISNDVTEYDLSGNGYNGTKQGITYSTDTPRYNLSSEFKANKELVFSDNRIYHQGDEVSNLSVSIWANFDSIAETMCFFNLNDNGFFRVEKVSTLLKIVAYMNDAAQYFEISTSGTFSSDQWYHIVTTFDKGIFKLYINGSLNKTEDKSSIATTIKCSNNTNQWKLGVAYNNVFLGKLSDFRIYATTLSADDVKALYNIGAQIDKSGKLYCGVLVEE